MLPLSSPPAAPVPSSNLWLWSFQVDLIRLPLVIVENGLLGQSFGKQGKDLLYGLSGLGGHLQVRGSGVPSAHRLFGHDVWLHVRLVSQNHAMLNLVVLCHLHPRVQPFKRLEVAEGKDQKDPVRPAKVAGRNGLEPLLSCRVPQLQLDLLGNAAGVHGDGLDLKVDANRGKVTLRKDGLDVAIEDGRFSHARMTRHNDLEEVVVRIVH